MKTITAIRPAHFCLFLFVVTIASSVYSDYIPLLREFNFDLPRMMAKIAKHPLAWVDWGRVFAMIGIALVVWRRDYDGNAFDLPGLWLVVIVALVFGLVDGWMLFAYLRERQKEQSGQSA